MNLKSQTLVMLMIVIFLIVMMMMMMMINQNQNVQAKSSCPDSTQSAASTSRLTPDAVLYSLSPYDGHNDARNMLS